MLSVERVSKVFGDAESGYPALKDISMDIGEGEFVCLLGPSGCGKTTLLKTIAGFHKPTAGRVEIGVAESAVAGEGADRVVLERLLDAGQGQEEGKWASGVRGQTLESDQ